MSLVKEGDTIQVHYKGTLDDGTEFDNSRQRGSTLEFQVGAGQLIAGFDTAVTGMGLGEVKTVTILCAEAYGAVQKEAFRDYPIGLFGEDIELEVGGVIQGTSPEGQPLLAKVTAVTDTTVTLDHNHPLAGKDLTFEIALVEIVE
jgi:peptidylprolyl isomerase